MAQPSANQAERVRSCLCPGLWVLSAPHEDVTDYRQELSYLSCSMWTGLPLNGQGGRGQQHAVVWSHALWCLEKQEKLIHPRPHATTTTGNSCCPCPSFSALPSQPMLTSSSSPTRLAWHGLFYTHLQGCFPELVLHHHDMAVLFHRSSWKKQVN